MSSMLDLSALIGHDVAAIDTPSLVVDLDAMERNLARMQSFADVHGVKLRPHAKMHKSAWLAQQQMQAGAVGVCVQKVFEAFLADNRHRICARRSHFCSDGTTLLI